MARSIRRHPEAEAELLAAAEWYDDEAELGADFLAEVRAFSARIADALPEVCHGKPCVRGTRVMVSSILGSLAAGFSRDEVLANYPGIRADDIDAALALAADLASYQTLSA